MAVGPNGRTSILAVLDEHGVDLVPIAARHNVLEGIRGRSKCLRADNPHAVDNPLNMRIDGNRGYSEPEHKNGPGCLFAHER